MAKNNYKFALARLGALTILNTFDYTDNVTDKAIKTLLTEKYDRHILKPMLEAMNSYVLHGSLDEFLASEDTEGILHMLWRMVDGKYSYVRKDDVEI